MGPARRTMFWNVYLLPKHANVTLMQQPFDHISQVVSGSAAAALLFIDAMA